MIKTAYTVAELDAVKDSRTFTGPRALIRAKAFCANHPGWELYTQVDSDSSDEVLYTQGDHLVNRTGVYAAVMVRFCNNCQSCPVSPPARCLRDDEEIVNPNSRICGEWMERNPNVSTRETKIQNIHCGKCRQSTPHDIDAEWATGVRLPNGYTPKAGEAIQFHSFTCKICGDYQVS